MPIVLVHNEVVSNPAHAWDDVEGVHYHYPSKYRRLIREGEQFVYYRGVHRIGGKRGPAEYVGSGRIGKIWEDPRKPRASYCAIDSYQRFPVPVPARVDDVLLEQIPRNLWRDGVRDLDPRVYARIINLAAAPKTQVGPNPEEVTVLSDSDLIVPPELISQRGETGAFQAAYRKTKQAKEVGDWAEDIVMRFITASIPEASSCIHRAALERCLAGTLTT